MTTTNTVPADDSLWTARDAIAGAFRTPRFAQRAAYRAELFRLARRETLSLTDAELDAGLRAMIAAGSIQARKVNGKTMYHYADWWQRRDAEVHLVLPPAFRPNFRARIGGLWQDADQTRTLAVLDKRPWQAEYEITLYDEEKRASTGTGLTAREAYREACRQQRLSRHTVPDLLRQIDGLERKLAIAERKIAADGALQLWLYDEMERLRQQA
ncbi:MAG: hypothetical protein KatS3mg051_1441 [Anaerolineae bacterium]|nr:MAG: hypothetical protein KatS3mg051_1441 [Anaerolineae bacterium]